MRALEFDVDQAEVRKMMFFHGEDGLDADGSGRMKFPEFLTMMTAKMSDNDSESAGTAQPRPEIPKADPAEWKALERRIGFTNGTMLRNGSPIMEQWNVQSFEFGVDGAEAFAEAMRFNPDLKTLVLFNDKLGDAGAAAIVKGLRDNKIALNGLYLGDNQIGDTGAAALAEYMRDSTTLRVLDLGFNRFGDAGAAAFAEGLRGNTALKELKLHHTRIGDAGAWALVESVKGNTALQYLQLHRTQICEGSKERKSCLPFLRKPATGKHALQAAWESTCKEAGSNLIQLEL